MNNDYMTSNDRLIFMQSKHDKTDGAFLVVIGCMVAILVIAQAIKLVG